MTTTTGVVQRKESLVAAYGDTTLMTWFPMWFSWFLLIVVYPAFLTLFAKLQYRN
jgi:hypothetical protein